MMMPRSGFTATVLALGLMLGGPANSAEEEFKLNPNNNVRRLMVYNLGKVVTVQTASGKELTGTVTIVGEHLVQLSRLSGREFYDAMVDYDHIEAVIIKTRSE